MKKAVAFACVGLLLIAGCGQKKTPVSTNTSDLTPPPPPSAVPAPTPAVDTYTLPTPAPTPAAVAPVKTTPAPAPAVKAAPKTAAAKTSTAGKKVYIVKKGDTLGKIAKAHKTTITKLKALNPKINPNKILVGQKIVLP